MDSCTLPHLIFYDNLKVHIASTSTELYHLGRLSFTIICLSVVLATLHNVNWCIEIYSQRESRYKSQIYSPCEFDAKYQMTQTSKYGKKL